MKISDCLLTLIHISGGIESYKINDYCSKLVELGYVEVTEDLKFVLTEKGKNHIKLYSKN